MPVNLVVFIEMALNCFTCATRTNLKAFVCEAIKITRRQAQLLISQKKIAINGLPPTSFTLQEGDVLQIDFNAEDGQDKETFNILVAEDDYVVIYKNAGVRIQDSLNSMPKSTAGLALLKVQQEIASNTYLEPKCSMQGLNIEEKQTNCLSCTYTMLCKQTQSIEQLGHHLIAHNGIITSYSHLQSKSCRLALLQLTFNLPLTINIKKLMAESGFSILGNSRLTTSLKASKNRGDYICCTAIQTFNNVVTIPTLTKFQTLIEKEKLSFYKSEECPKEVVMFYELQFKVNNLTLVPRKSSEALVDMALRYLKPNYIVLDLGSGTGNLIISILKSAAVNLTGLAMDISLDAIELTLENAKIHGITITAFLGSFEHIKLEKEVDFIVCNPPYLNAKQITNFNYKDPFISLSGGNDGYDAYGVLAKSILSNPMIKHGCLVCLEVNNDVMQGVQSLFDVFKVIDIGKDFKGMDRCVLFIKP